MRPLFSIFNVLSLALLGLAALALRMVQAPPATPDPPKLQAANQKQVKATLYFSDSQVQGFVKQVREVLVPQTTPVSVAQATLNAWAAGPQGGGAVAVVPKGSKVPQVWLRGEHFVVNLPQNYTQLNYGSSGERMLICSLTRTLLEQRGKDVMFLVGGQNASTLLGHADLSSPYAREDCAEE
ncbi:GerMN domain-containing protein [Deinococcus sonorensis]|uniref:GerMN domain-containing protein n=2 Tax=Deinococcus sonorensis TaxID=309891 RepID=A0AAU7U9G6_9DEIO